MAYVESLPGGKSGITVAPVVGPGSVEFASRPTRSTRAIAKVVRRRSSRVVARQQTDRLPLRLRQRGGSDQCSNLCGARGRRRGETDNAPHWIAGRPALVAGWESASPFSSRKTRHPGRGADPTGPDSGVLNPRFTSSELQPLTSLLARSVRFSPPNMYIYEYDWLPDGGSFAVSRAAGMGDNNWWIAMSIRCLRPAAN